MMLACYEYDISYDQCTEGVTEKRWVFATHVTALCRDPLRPLGRGCHGKLTGAVYGETG